MDILKNVKRLLQQRASYQAQLDRIDQLLAPFGSIKAGKADPTVGAAKVDKRRKVRKPMSAAAKAKISAGRKTALEKGQSSRQIKTVRIRR